MRKSQEDQACNVLLDHTVQWANALPENVRPLTLMRQFPRVANMLALLWAETTCTPFDEYMESLVVDRRGNRQGFPPTVMSDLLSLREAFTRIRGQRLTESPHADNRGR